CGVCNFHFTLVLHSGGIIHSCIHVSFYLSIIIFPIDLCALFPSNKLQLRTYLPTTYFHIFPIFSISRLFHNLVSPMINSPWYDSKTKARQARRVLAMTLNIAVSGPGSNAIQASGGPVSDGQLQLLQQFKKKMHCHRD